MMQIEYKLVINTRNVRTLSVDLEITMNMRNTDTEYERSEEKKPNPHIKG